MAAVYNNVFSHRPREKIHLCRTDNISEVLSRYQRIQASASMRARRSFQKHQAGNASEELPGRL